MDVKLSFKLNIGLKTFMVILLRKRQLVVYSFQMKPHRHMQLNTTEAWTRWLHKYYNKKNVLKNINILTSIHDKRKVSREEIADTI